MARTILGIDIGSAYIKLAWANRTFRESRIVATDLEPAEHSAGVQGIAQQISGMVQRNGISPDSVVVAVSSEQALFQWLSFPFSQPSKIEEVLPFELENHVPVNLSGYVRDFMFTGGGRAGETEVVAALYEQEWLAGLSAALEEHGLAPGRIDLDLAVLVRLSSTLLAEPEESLLVLDLGWSKTNLVWRIGGRIVSFRSLPAGLGDIVRELDEDVEPSSVPRIRKLLQGLELQSGRKGPRSSALSDLQRQVRMSLMAADTEGVPERIVFAGGGARCEPVVSFLQERLQARAMKLEEAMPEDGGSSPATAIAATAAMRRADQRDGYNLLRGELARQEQRLLPRRQVRFLAVAACVLVLLSSFSFGLDIYLQSRKLSRLQSRLQSTFHRIVPDAPDSVQPMQYPSVIRSRIAALDSGSVGADVPPVKVSVLLSRISEALPSNLNVQTTLFALDRQTLRLSGLAEDFNTVDTIKNRLSGLALFSRVEIVGANSDQRGQGVRFNLRISLESGG